MFWEIQTTGFTSFPPKEENFAILIAFWFSEGRGVVSAVSLMGGWSSGKGKAGSGRQVRQCWEAKRLARGAVFARGLTWVSALHWSPTEKVAWREFPSCCSSGENKAPGRPSESHLLLLVIIWGSERWWLMALRAAGAQLWHQCATLD